MVQHINTYIFVFIILLASVLRFYALDTIPPALTWDEASWGINAYSLSVSGRDEFGKFLPITYLESFGDFKPPMYAYLTVIPVWIFGLNEFSIRFTSAFFGVLTILLTYFLVKELFFTMRNKETVGLIAAFLLAISPWHILLSRAAFEANVATFFIILGTLLFLHATREKKRFWLLALSLIFYVMAFYTFNTSRVFLPFFVLILFAVRHKVLVQNWVKTLIFIFTGFIIALPVLLFMLTPQAQLRFHEVNIFSDISVIERTNQQIENSGNTFFSRIIHNRRLAYGAEFISHYLDNLDPKFLFIKGDGNPKFSIQDVGQMYIWELPFLIIGALLLFRRREGVWVIIPFWILLGIIPAATARETPHALRIETIVPTLQILTAYGIFFVFGFVQAYVKKRLLRRAMWVLSGGIVVFFLVYFLHNYFNHYPVTYASEWQYGYKEAIAYTQKHQNNYEKIYFTQDLGRPYAYVMLYGNYPIDILQKDADIRREALGFVHVDRLGKYHFLKEFPNESAGSLFVNVPDKVPSQVHVVKTVNFPNGKPALIIYER